MWLRKNELEAGPAASELINSENHEYHEYYENYS